MYFFELYWNCQRKQRKQWQIGDEVREEVNRDPGVDMIVMENIKS